MIICSWSFRYRQILYSSQWDIHTFITFVCVSNLLLSAAQPKLTAATITSLCLDKSKALKPSGGFVVLCVGHFSCFTASPDPLCPFWTALSSIVPAFVLLISGGCGDREADFTPKLVPCHSHALSHTRRMSSLSHASLWLSYVRHKHVSSDLVENF